MRTLLIAFLLSSASAALAEETTSKSIDAAIHDLSDDAFDTRQTAERIILALINSGRQSEVQKALTAAIENKKSDAELKGRAAKLLQLCDVVVSDGLAARLVVDQIKSDGMLHISAPFEELPQIVFRVTNINGKAFQVAHASYPVYAFFRFEVVKLDDDGKKRTPVHAYFDLYPFKDMQMPNKVFETLEPGASFERDMNVLLRQGYLMVSLQGRPNNQDESHLYGQMRSRGVYEITGVYSIQASKENSHFESERGRDKNVPLWAGTTIRTKPILLKVDK